MSNKREEMLNITKHWGNANQNHKERPPAHNHELQAGRKTPGGEGPAPCCPQNSHRGCRTPTPHQEHRNEWKRPPATPKGQEGASEGSGTWNHSVHPDTGGQQGGERWPLKFTSTQSL